MCCKYTFSIRNIDVIRKKYVIWLKYLFNVQPTFDLLEYDLTRLYYVVSNHKSLNIRMYICPPLAASSIAHALKIKLYDICFCLQLQNRELTKANLKRYTCIRLHPEREGFFLWNGRGFIKKLFSFISFSNIKEILFI